MRRLSLRARLVLLVVASIVPLTAFMLTHVYIDYREAIEDSGRRNLELARSLAVAVEKDLQARIAVLQVLAISKALREADLDLFRTQVETVLTNQFPDSIILLLREDGQQVLNTLVPKGGPLPARRNLESIRQVFATGRPAVSDVFRGAVSQRLLVAVDVPVRRPDGTIVYVLSGIPPVDAFADTIRRQRLPEGWLASVYDRKGMNVARNLNPEQNIGRQAAPALHDRLLAEPEGVLVFRSREGIEVVSAFSHIEPFGWSVAIAAPLGDVTAPAVGAARRALAAAGAALVVGIFLAFAVARQVTRPMAVLRRLASAADRDEVLNAPPTGLDEADEVVQALVAAEQHRKQSEEKRSEAERQGQRIFETSQDVIIVTDGYGTLVQVSPSSAKALGYQPEEMIGRNGQDFAFPDDVELARAEMRAARQGRATRQFKCRYVHKDGHVVPFLWMEVWSEPDRRHYFIGRDMTEYERTEEQLRQAQKMEAVGQLTGGIAHDFNNILMVIMANVDALEEEGRLEPPLLDRIKGISNATQRATGLTRQLLAFSRKQALRPQPTNVNDLVTTTGTLLRRTLGERIEIQSIMADDLWNVEIDRAQLESALVNLSINSRDAMPDGGRLLIETKNIELDDDYAERNPGVVPGDYVMLAITDTGQGIPPETLDKVFEPFFTTKAVGRGTGLGLSMVYGFIKQSGGHIKIYSEVGRGTSIKLYLPRHDGEPDKAAVVPGTPTARGSERILVVEDDAQVRASVMRQLQSLGYAVAEASDAKAALAAFEAAASPYDLLLTDVVMPGPVNGSALAEQVVLRWPEAKVVFMSGYTEDAVVHHGRLDAGLLLLSKPFRKSDLAQIIRQALDGADDRT